MQYFHTCTVLHTCCMYFYNFTCIFTILHVFLQFYRVCCVCINMSNKRNIINTYNIYNIINTYSIYNIIIQVIYIVL